jgi:hypothetical protein
MAETNLRNRRPDREWLRLLVDSLALAGAGMAGVYVGDLLDPSNLSGNQTRRKDWPD